MPDPFALPEASSRASSTSPPIRFGTSARLPLLYAALFSLLAPTLFYGTLLFGGPLSGHDWSSHHYHYFDWVRIALTQHGAIPLYMAGAWITPNFLANAEAPQLGPLVWLLLFVSTGFYLKLLIVLFSAAGTFGMLALLRELGVVTPLAVIAALCFAFNGFFTSHYAVGHPWAMGAQLLPLMVLLYRRAVYGSTAALLAAAVINTFTIFGGQHQPFIWQNLFLALLAAAWSVQARSTRPLRALVLLALFSAGLGAVKILPMLAEFSDYAPTQRTIGIPLEILGTTLLARGQGPDSVFPGLDFAHGSGWWEWAFYVGPLVLLFALVGCCAARRVVPYLAVGTFFLVISIHWPGTTAAGGPWGLLEGLPVWRTQRSPSRFLVLAVFAFSICGALGWQRLWEARISSWPRALPLIAAVVAILVALDARIESQSWQSAAVGEGVAAYDPRPRPLSIGDSKTATAELRGVLASGFVYQVQARTPTTLVFPLRMRRGVDDWNANGLRPGSRGGKLALDLPAGDRELVIAYRPRFLVAGSATSAATLLMLGITWWRRDK